LIGWTDGENVFLEPDVVYAEVQRLAVEQGESLPVTPQTLRRRLKEKGLLATTDTARRKLTVRKMFQGDRREVLPVAWTGAPSARKDGSTSAEGEIGTDVGPEMRASAWAGNGYVNGDLAHAAAVAGASGQPPSAVGPPMGRLGQSDPGADEAAGANQSEQQADSWGDWQ
jgi:hypothetical protein